MFQTKVIKKNSHFFGKKNDVKSPLLLTQGEKSTNLKNVQKYTFTKELSHQSKTVSFHSSRKQFFHVKQNINVENLKINDMSEI